MANSSRAHGLILMAVGMLVFAGTTNDTLPAEAFWPALVLCVIGCFVFMKANRVVLEAAEERTRRALDPVLRNERVDRFAETQEQVDGEKIAQRSPSSLPPRPIRSRRAPAPRARCRATNSPSTKWTEMWAGIATPPAATPPMGTPSR